MSRFGTGLGFNKYNASLWGGGTEIFTANVANLNGVDQAFLAPVHDYGDEDVLTINFWVYRTDDSITQVLLNANDAGASEIPIISAMQSTGILYFTHKDNSFQELYTVTPLALNQWSMLTFISDNDQSNGGANRRQEIYINSVLNSSRVPTEDRPKITVPLHIGEEHNGNLPLEGRLMNLEVMGEILDQDALDDRYGGGLTKCLDLLEYQGGGVLWPLYNKAGFIGQELKDQKSDAVTLTNVGSTPFTGSAQIECEA